MSSRVIAGFDYRDQRPRELPRAEWDEELAQVEKAGGSCLRIDGDMTAFDARRRMQFEVYDQRPKSKRETSRKA